MTGQGLRLLPSSEVRFSFCPGKPGWSLRLLNGKAERLVWAYKSISHSIRFQAGKDLVNLDVIAKIKCFHGIDDTCIYDSN